MSKLIIVCAVSFFILNRRGFFCRFNLGWIEYKYFILSVFLFLLSSLFFHQLHGDYMEVVRAIFYFLFIAVLTTFFHKQIQWRWIEFSLVVGAALSFIYSGYDYFILGQSRVGGYMNQIIFAQAIFPLFLLNFILFLYKVKVSNKFGMALHLSSSILCVACIIWSGTRGVWLALPMVFVISLFYIVKNGVKLTTAIKAVALFVFVFFVLFGNEVSLRYEQAKSDISMVKMEQNVSASSLGGRFYVWQAALMMAKEKPLFGIGRDNFEKTITEYIASGALEPQQQVFPHAHNGYLNALAMNGIVGLLFYMLFLISPLFLINKQHLLSLSSLSLLSLVVSYAIFSLTDVPFVYQINIYMYLFSSIIIVKLDRRILN